MKKTLRGLMALLFLLSSLAGGGHKAEANVRDKALVKNDKKTLVLQHAKDIFSNKDAKHNTAWHESHYSHESHSSHVSHYSHYSGY